MEHLANQLEPQAPIKEVVPEQHKYVKEKPMTKEEFKALLATDSGLPAAPSKTSGT